MQPSAEIEAVNRTYTVDPEAFVEQVAAWLTAQGKDPKQATIDDLAPVDQFHTGFMKATLALLDLAELPHGGRVVDVGGGMGGPARLLAKRLDARVTVVDMLESFCRIGETFTRWTGLEHAVDFLVGNVLELPLPDECADAVWMQNVDMHISDKRRLFGEIARVLRPGGRLAIQSVMAGPVQPIVCPVVFADDPAHCFLCEPSDIRALAKDLGLAERTWIDATSILSGGQPPAASPADSNPAPDPMGRGDLTPLRANMRRNFSEQRAMMVWAVFERR